MSHFQLYSFFFLERLILFRQIKKGSVVAQMSTFCTDSRITRLNNDILDAEVHFNAGTNFVFPIENCCSIIIIMIIVNIRTDRSAATF